ncbi:TetR family transcriptional regulator [Nonomuraea sp. NN258]|uniref:TetR/AcrR family transcriptional regulator n=1 Tax=Nonomuraea antri TaxID=2730852 RepID=UPI001568E8FF|nr:TetR-like C-terminal domain-containing protein [Nonomuraea antri]NRQ32861.1 TetR family transcriptional regulator [Nonomuraea antri]
MARAGLTADRVTEAAADLADSVGFDNITISALARSFGVKDASLYSHVRNVQDLKTRVAVRAAAQQAELVTDAIAGRAGKDALIAFAAAYREFALAHPGRYAATQVQLDPAIVAQSPDPVRAEADKAVKRVHDTMHALLSAYGLSEPDFTDAVRLLRSTFHGFVALEAAAGFGHPRPPHESWRRIVEALDGTLRHWPPPDSSG